MAIGTAAAIGLGVAGVGSALGASSNKKAARRAADISAQNNAANVALQRDIYNQNKGIISPFVDRGNVAGGAINALLGLGGGSQVQGGPAQVGTNALSQFQPAAGRYGLGDNGGFGASVLRDTMRVINPQNTMGQGGVQPTAPMTTQQPGMNAQQAQNQAFENFRNSTGYQFRVGEAQNALNSGFAGSGLLQSGAALRGLDDLRQNMASAEFGNFVNLLGQQQAVGAGSASALAGVGQNFASNVAQMNTLNANNQANAAIARAQNNPFNSLLGTIGGGLLGFGG